MNNFCYTLAIRQRRCQNGISRELDNVYTNVTTSSIIQLSFGYVLTVISKNPNSISIQISNPNFMPNTIFNIPSGSFKIFDLPTENGTLRVFIGATGIDCSDTVVCCTL
ncbi:MAG: hypothetical protein Q4D02_03045 [Clostridia bacterium]|nr:hypothetical protein [Clostridia bacterium]